MKLQILSDGSMVLDGDAVGLAEFAKAMRVTTTVATSVDTTVATTVAAASAPVESTTAAKTSAAKGANTKFILELCTDWTRRTVILSRATAAGLNANSVGVQLPILADRGRLEGRTAEDGRVEYRTKPVDHAAS